MNYYKFFLSFIREKYEKLARDNFFIRLNFPLPFLPSNPPYALFHLQGWWTTGIAPFATTSAFSSIEGDKRFSPSPFLPKRREQDLDFRS